jgi:hypothetical protein
MSCCECLKKFLHFSHWFPVENVWKCFEVVTCIYTEKHKKNMVINNLSSSPHSSVKKVQQKMMKNVWKHGFLISNFTLFFVGHFSHILLSFSKWKFRWKKFCIFHTFYYPYPSENSGEKSFTFFTHFSFHFPSENSGE